MAPPSLDDVQRDLRVALYAALERMTEEEVIEYAHDITSRFQAEELHSIGITATHTAQADSRADSVA